LFRRERIDRVLHLAAQASVRHSIDHPLDYGRSNLMGFLNVLEGCRNPQVSIGRPSRIAAVKPQQVYYAARMSRDFTYMDDIVDGEAPHRVFNLGNHQPQRRSRRPH
jgi:nucleoside-diphosphate-sugar epimerase